MGGVMNGVVPRAVHQPMVVYNRECECSPSSVLGVVCGVFCLVYGVATCCDCCSGDCLDVCTYENLPFWKTRLEPNNDLDRLPEETKEQIAAKLNVAMAQLAQLDQSFQTRKRVHRCASTLLCPLVCLPRSLSFAWHCDDDPPQNQNLRPYPETNLDLIYQFTLPCLRQSEERGRVGLREFLSPPEVQRMIDLETKIIPALQEKS